MEFRDVRGVEITPYEIVGAVPGEHIGLPTSTVTLVVDLDDGLRLTDSSPAPERTFRCCLGGMTLEPVTIHHDGTQIGVQLSLAPTAVRNLLGLPAGELWDLNIELGDAAPALARRLHDETGAVPHEERAVVAARIVVEEMESRSTPTADPDAERAWALIQRTRGRITVAKLVEMSGWSARKLTGLFTAEYGVGPKQAARLARFEHARERLHAGEPIADVAVECGYADQAHLTREFAALTGHPPKEFLAVRAAEFSGAT